MRVYYFLFFTAAFFVDSLAISIGSLDIRCNELLLGIAALIAIAVYHASAKTRLFKRVLLVYGAFFVSGIPGIFFADYSAGIMGLARSILFPAFLASCSVFIVPSKATEFAALFKGYLDACMIASITLIIASLLHVSADRISFPFYEPSQLAVGILPALLLSLSMTNGRLYFVPLFSSILIGRSSLVFTALLVVCGASLVINIWPILHKLISLKYRRGFILLGFPLLLAFLAFIFYFLLLSPDSEMRFGLFSNASFLSAAGSDVIKLGGTASSLLASLQALITTIKLYPLFGLGHGGTSVFFNAEICTILGTCQIDVVNYYNSNGSNLAFRTLGDLGILGLALFIGSLCFSLKSWISALFLACRMILVYIINGFIGLVSKRSYTDLIVTTSTPSIWFHIPFIVIFASHLLRKESLASFYLSFWMVVSLSAQSFRGNITPSLK